MAIELIDKIKQKNGGTFKLMDAEDIAFGEHSLTEEIDSVKTQLSEARKKSESIEMSDLSTTVKEAIVNGGQNIPVVGEDSVGSENLKYGGVGYKALYPEIRNTIIESGNYRLSTINCVFEEKNGGLFDEKSNTIIVPVGNTADGTVIRNITNYDLMTDEIVTVAMIVNRSKQLGTLWLHCKATRNNTLINLEQIDSEIHFLKTTNELLYISKFQGKTGDANLTPTILYTNTEAADTQVTHQISYYFAGVGIENAVLKIKKETDATIQSIQSIEASLFEKEIYHDFDDVKNNKVELLNGATKVDDNRFMIPIGSLGADSYIGADFYLNDKTPKKITIYSVVNVSNVSLHKPTDFKMTKFIPSTSGLVEATTDTHYKSINDNTYILYSEHDYNGEEYVKVRVQLKASKYAQVDTTVFIGGFLYAYTKSAGTINKSFTDSINKLINNKIAKIKIPDVSDKELIFNGESDNFTQVIKDITGDVIFEIVENFNTTLRIFGIKDGKEYLLPITNLKTGTTSKEVVYCSKYKAETSGFTTFKFERHFSDGGYRSPMKVYLLSSSNETPIQSVGEYHHVINYNNISNEVINVNDLSTYGVRNGKVLATKAVNGTVELHQSDSTYKNFTKISTIPNATEHPTHVEICDNGTVLMLFHNGKLLRTEDLTNYSEAKSINDNVYMWGGFTQLDVYKNIVLLSEYRQPAKHGQSWESTNGGGKLYMSDDYGKTFKAIFDLPVNMGIERSKYTHIHAIKYDPYENIVWIVTGDSLTNQMIWYSLDHGQNWYTSTEFRESAVQMTAIYPLRNCVLFGTDARLVGVARYNRPKCGTLPNVKMHLDFPFIIAEGWGNITKTNVPVASRGAINYDKSIVFFGFLGAPYIHNDNLHDVLKYGEVYATDGYTFFNVYKSDSTVDFGVIAVYEDVANNKVIAKQGISGKFVTINADVFDKI